MDFGCVGEGEERVHQIELINSSPAEAVYQWDLDCNGHSVFNIHPACGIVRPHSHTSLKAVYSPTEPNAHHRRVPCLILHKVGGKTEAHSQQIYLGPYNICLISPLGPRVCRPAWYLYLKVETTIRTGNKK